MAKSIVASWMMLSLSLMQSCISTQLYFSVLAYFQETLIWSLLNMMISQISQLRQNKQTSNEIAQVEIDARVWEKNHLQPNSAEQIA